MTGKLWLAAIGLMCLAWLETLAVIQNIDGAMFGAVIAAIALIVGYAFGVKSEQAVEAVETMQETLKPKL